MKERLIQFDFLKLVAIFLVCYGHCIQYLLPTKPYEEIGYLLIYSFHMPLFMAISGFFAYSSMGMDFLHFFKKYSKRLLLPCITWSLGVVLMRIIFAESLEWNDINNDLWFLKSLFICTLLSKIVFQEKNATLRFVFLCATLLLSQAVPLYRLCYMYPSYIAGCFFAKHQHVLHQKSLLAGSLAIYGFLIWMFLDETFFDTHHINQIPQAGGVLCIILTKIIVLMTGLSAISFLMSLVTQFKVDWNKSIFKYGKYTLGVYLFQTIIIEHVCSLLLDVSSLSRLFLYLVVFPIISTMCVCLGSYLQKRVTTPIAAKLLYGKFR